MLVAAGAVDQLVTTYVLRSGGRQGGSAVERALQAGALHIEDYTNYNYNARLMAGMHGFSFMQVFEGITVTDLFKKRSFLGEDKYRIIKCPYTGKDVVTVPAANPDVCIVHVQRADKFGNAQYWGAIGSVPAAALASKRIIKKYTLNELLIIAAAREIHNYDNVILGVGLPTTAGALAKALHASQANLMMEAGMIDFDPLIPPNHIADAMACKGYACATDLFTAFTMTYRGFVDICFLGVGQIDKYGNLNTTSIGDYYQPDLRLPGSGGAADFISYSKRTVLTMRGGEFVEKLDYFTSPVYLDGGDARERCGLFPKDSGPSRLITRKGIFELDPATKGMYLAEIHPRMTVRGIKKDVPWDLKISENLLETQKPSDEEIDFIRRFAPAAAMGRALATEMVFANLAKELEARGKL